MLCETLLPTQSGVRDVSSIAQMIEFVRAGGIFSVDAISLRSHKSRLIEVVYLDDQDRFVLQDGHHRVAAMCLAGRKNILPCEYRLTVQTTKSYSEINLPVWSTPMDVLHQVRSNNIGKWKYTVNMMHDLHGRTAAIKWIQDNISSILCPRNSTCDTMHNFAAALAHQI